MNKLNLDNLRDYGYAPRYDRDERVVTTLIAIGMFAGFALMAMMGVLD